MTITSSDRPQGVAIATLKIRAIEEHSETSLWSRIGAPGRIRTSDARFRNQFTIVCAVMARDKGAGQDKNLVRPVCRMRSRLRQSIPKRIPIAANTPPFRTNDISKPGRIIWSEQQCAPVRHRWVERPIPLTHPNNDRRQPLHVDATLLRVGTTPDPG